VVSLSLSKMKIALLLAAVSSVASLKLPVQTFSDRARTFPQDAAAPRSIFVVTLSKAAASEEGSALGRNSPPQTGFERDHENTHCAHGCGAP
jgi:hypothetical protein